MYRYQQLEAALMTRAGTRRGGGECVVLDSYGRRWNGCWRMARHGENALRRVFAGLRRRRRVSGPLLISYFIDNMVARHHLPLASRWRPPKGLRFRRRVSLRPALLII